MKDCRRNFIFVKCYSASSRKNNIRYHVKNQSRCCIGIILIKEAQFNNKLKKKIFEFKRCENIIYIQFAQRQRTMMNEKKNTTYEIATSKKTHFEMMIVLADIDRDQSNQTIKIIEEIHEFFEYSEILNKTKKTSEHVSNIYKK